LLPLVENEAVERVKLRADLEPRLLGDVAPDDRLPLFGVEQPPAWGQGELAPLPVFEVRKEALLRPDYPVAPAVGAAGSRDGELDVRVFLYRVVHLPGDIPGRRLQVKDGVKDQLELASTRSEDGVEPRGAAGEGVVRLVPDAEYRHHETGRERHRQDGDYGR